MEATSLDDASLSRNLQGSASVPHILHSLHESQSSALSLAASDTLIFSGNQSNDISVWEKKTYAHKDTLKGHTGSVLCLVYAKEKEWLFSSSGDSTIRIWSTVTLRTLYIIDPYLETGAGDLFSMTWSPTLQTIYIGCQNTSLQWLDFKAHYGGDGTMTPTTSAIRKAHKFFDSYPRYERKPADLFANNGTGIGSPLDSPASLIARLSIPVTNVIDSVHYGYIYAMTIVEDTGLLATGSGDETIKLWDCSNTTPTLIHDFQCYYGAVYALLSKGETLYAACQEGLVKIIDTETKTLVRTIIVQEGSDILSMSMINSDLYVCCASGLIWRYSATFDCTASWKAHEGIILSSIIITDNPEQDNFRLVTGGNDGFIKIWAITPPKDRLHTLELGDDHDCRGSPQEACSRLTGDTMAYALSKFVSIPSVSKNHSNREDCRQAAIWLKKCLSQLGAKASLLPTSENMNPLVLGTFQGTQGDPSARPRILFYGHYDVVSVSAPSKSWATDPFILTGLNGYLYGRGATDDKGPIMAVACAAAELLARRSLGVDIVFLIEGEEEQGSVGFKSAVQANKELIGKIDSILVSNSTWISDDIPCITYGLRGVVHCTIEISSHLPDHHSGVDGGAIAEPMLDMVNLLATLSNSQRVVQIPGFYSSVRPQTKEEIDLYEHLSQLTGKPASSLSSRWREPALTVHSVEASGARNETVIPGTVKAQVSLRIVPDQDLDTIVSSLHNHLESSFQELKSPNQIKINVAHTADWWLGNLDDPWFKALESSVREEWGVEPLRIREGGSIPSVPYLEKEFGCHALHLPLGQSSDQAHLPNERISVANLHRGKSVVERFLQKGAALG